MVGTPAGADDVLSGATGGDKGAPTVTPRIKEVDKKGDMDAEETDYPEYYDETMPRRSAPPPAHLARRPLPSLPTEGMSRQLMAAEVANEVGKVGDKLSSLQLEDGNPRREKKT